MSDIPETTYDRTRRLAFIARCARYGTVALLIVLFFATHIPPSSLRPPVLGIDKLLHAVAYLILTISALTSIDLSIGSLRAQHYFNVWLVGTVYGAFDEVTQIPVGRHCDVLDWICDILGIVVGLLVFRFLRPLVYRLIG